MRFFADKVILITGGAAGIGRALGEETAKLGAKVTLTDSDGQSLDDTVSLIRSALGPESAARVEGRLLDVTDPDQFKQVADELRQRHGRLDFLFNNAGIGITGELEHLPAEAWDPLIDVNLKGVIHGVQAVYPLMVEQGFGHIANTACVAGLVPFPMTTAYSATKHAVVGLSTSLRPEAARKGVRVSVICPGVVDTDMFESIEYFGVDKQALLSPVGRAMMSPDVCARRILTGLRWNRPVITVGWNARLIWWLYRIAPRFFLRMVAFGFRTFRHRFLH